MCGIAGVVAWSDKFRTSRETLARMSATIAHRGPDGEGLYLNHEQEVTPDRPQAALAFRRLAILDPDPRAMQPFHLYDAHGKPRLTLTFNGEIYNFRELRAELSALRSDYAWRTTGDTEVLLLAYDTWREKALEKLNGMYACAVWDEQKEELFLARDRMGQKPLYLAYVAADGSPTHPVPPISDRYDAEDPTPIAAVVFASEIPAVRAAGVASAALNPRALISYLQLGYVGAYHTIYRGITALAPGTYARIAGGKSYETPYWTGPRYPDYRKEKPAADADAVRATRDLVTTAVRRQLVADVPLGCLLSGGIDSSVVAAAMARAVAPGQEVLTFSIGFDDPRYDEREYAAAVAKHLGTRHRAFTVRPDVAADLPKLAAVFGQPFGDSSALPTHYLARETRQHVKVALGGDGGDELFGGYDRYRAMLLARRLRHAVTPLPWMALAPVARRLPGSTHPKSATARARRFLSSVAKSAMWRYSGYMRLFDEATILRLVRPGLLPPDDLASAARYDEAANHFGFAPRGYPTVSALWVLNEVRAAMHVDSITYLPDDLLAKVDRASMLHNLEVRSPFMDHELVGFAATLTTNQLIGGGPKRMLREAFAADLPDFVFTRKKMGFAVPVGDWFRTSLRDMLHDHLFAPGSFARAYFDLDVVRELVADHESGRADHSQRLYALLMLELWHAVQ